MVDSASIIENMMYSYVIILVVNVLVTLRVLDSVISFATASLSHSNVGAQDFMTLFVTYQQGVDSALQVSAGGIPYISPLFQLLSYTLKVYVKRISEITLICITPTVLFTIKGYLWVYLVPKWMDDGLDQISMKWRNTLLYLTYGEDFTHPPPLEVDQSAIPPQRSPEEEEARYHPKFGFQSTASCPAHTQTPPSSPSRKGRRKAQKLQQLREQQQIIEEKQKEAVGVQEEHDGLENQGNDSLDSNGNESVWDPTWGVISRELQASWQAEEESRLNVLQSREQRAQKPLPPVRS